MQIRLASMKVTPAAEFALLVREQYSMEATDVERQTHADKCSLKLTWQLIEDCFILCVDINHYHGWPDIAICAAEFLRMCLTAQCPSP